MFKKYHLFLVLRPHQTDWVDFASTFLANRGMCTLAKCAHCCRAVISIFTSDLSDSFLFEVLTPKTKGIYLILVLLQLLHLCTVYIRKRKILKIAMMSFLAVTNLLSLYYSVFYFSKHAKLVRIYRLLVLKQWHCCE